MGRDGIVVVSEPTFSVAGSYTHLRQLHVITDQPVVEADLLRSIYMKAAMTEPTQLAT